MNWQLYRSHAMLFVCAYVGLLGYFAVTDPNDPVAAVFKASAQTEVRPQPLVAAPSPVITSNRAAENVSVAKAVVPAAESEDTARQQEERARLSAVRLQAVKAEQPQERAQAIDQLKAASPETLQALQTVITSDSAVRNRIRALNSLRTLGEQEDAKDAVISIVHLARVDTNASVASRASEVYRELTEERATDE